MLGKFLFTNHTLPKAVAKKKRKAAATGKKIAAMAKQKLAVANAQAKLAVKQAAAAGTKDTASKAASKAALDAALSEKKKAALVAVHWEGNGLAASDRFQTPVSDQCHRVMSSCHVTRRICGVHVIRVACQICGVMFRTSAEKGPVGSAECHFGYALVLTEIQESNRKVWSDVGRDCGLR